MATTVSDIQRLLVRELESFAQEIALFPDDATLWKTVPGVANPVGNLSLHVCGNLNFFVGSVLGSTGYVRDRDAECQTRSRTREELIAQLHHTSEILARSLSHVTEEMLSREYPEPVAEVILPCRLFLLHLCVHAGFHLGQAGYLRRALTGDNRSTNPVPIKTLAD